MENNVILSAVLQGLLEFLLPIVAVAIISALVSWAKLLWAKPNRGIPIPLTCLKKLQKLP